MRKYLTLFLLLTAVLSAMGGVPKNGWSKDYLYLRGDVFVLDETHAAAAQEFNTQQTGLALYRVEMEALEREFRNHYHLRIYVRKTNPELQITSIKYMVRFFDDTGNEYKSLILEDNSPSFPGGVSSPTWFNNLLYRKPYTLKIRVQSYVLKNGKEVSF